MCKSSEHGKQFTFSHFVIFFYRVLIMVFDHTILPQKKYKGFNLIRKLIYMFRELERGDATISLLNKLGRTYTKTLSFLPSKDLIA
jgi:hypothetical protein